MTYPSVLKTIEKKLKNLRYFVKVWKKEALCVKFIVHFFTKGHNTLGMTVCQITSMLVSKKVDNFVEVHFLI